MIHNKKSIGDEVQQGELVVLGSRVVDLIISWMLSVIGLAAFVIVLWSSIVSSGLMRLLFIGLVVFIGFFLVLSTAHSIKSSVKISFTKDSVLFTNWLTKKCFNYRDITIAEELPKRSGQSVNLKISFKGDHSWVIPCSEKNIDDIYKILSGWNIDIIRRSSSGRRGTNQII